MGTPGVKMSPYVRIGIEKMMKDGVPRKRIMAAYNVSHTVINKIRREIKEKQT